MTRLVGLKALPKSIGDWLLVVAFVLALIAVGIGAVFAQPLDKPVLVVALKNLDSSPGWARTVMIATPLGDAHTGVILNRPTRLTMAEVFPDHEPSKAVKDPVFRGGPHRSDVVIAVVRAEASPGMRSFELMPGVWLAWDAAVIDEIIEKRPNDARYYAGAVYWRPGELAEEIRKGMVAVYPADPAKLFLRDTSKLYDELAPHDRKPKREV